MTIRAAVILLMSCPPSRPSGKQTMCLGTDHAAFARRALRAFEGTRLDPETRLPAYVADSKTGVGLGSARGVGLSFMLIWAPELWPETAQQWYAQYEKHFWQEGWLLAGFREFPRKHPIPNWRLFDVDAGPVLAGYGTAASAFGIGAARANGDFEHAYPLSARRWWLRGLFLMAGCLVHASSRISLMLPILANRLCCSV